MLSSTNLFELTLARLFDFARLEFRAWHTADQSMHATRAGSFLLRWWGYVQLAFTQMSLSTQAVDFVDPKSVLLAQAS